MVNEKFDREVIIYKLSPCTVNSSQISGGLNCFQYAILLHEVFYVALPQNTTKNTPIGL